MLTATPVNNRLLDLQHMIELFFQHESDYFAGAPLGIHSLPGHFRKLEKELETSSLGRQAAEDIATIRTDQADSELLGGQELFREIVVQRSRSVRAGESEEDGGRQTIFPIAKTRGRRVLHRARPTGRY